MNEKYEKAFAELIGNEGGFKKQHSDPMDWTGGKVGAGRLVGTKFGLSAGTYPNEDIPNMTLDRARFLYKRDWWDYFGGDDLEYELAFQIFDTLVNHGKSGGAKILQRALKVDDDGKIGKNTRAALVKQNDVKFLVLFMAERLEFFTECKTWAENGRGWAKRIAGNMRKAVTP